MTEGDDSGTVRSLPPARGAVQEHADRPAMRVPLIAALVTMLAAAVIVGDRTVAGPGAPPPVTDAVSMPRSDARSSAWYCPGAPASQAVRVRQMVTVTNLADRESAAAVTIMAAGYAPTGKQIALPAHSIVQVVPSDLSEAPQPGVIVEPFSSGVVVEQNLNADGELEVAPCATQPSDHWYFANGTTERGTEQWLELFNPFGDDAIVDVSFFTDEGLTAPESLHGLEVPRRSSLAVPVYETVRRQALVATVVDARAGRVVAQQSQIFLADSGRRGIAMSLGAVATAVEWWFADGGRARGESRSIGIANPGGYDTEVDVQVVADGDAIIEPVTVSVARDSVASVALGGCGENGDPACIRVPSGMSYSVLVSSASDTPVVAQSVETWTDEAGPIGATSSVGSREAARRWVFARSRVQETTQVWIAVLNTGNRSVVVGLTRVSDGALVEPAELQSLLIAPGERRVIDLAALGEGDAGVIVAASAPVVAERFISRASTATRSPGVPDRR